MILILIGVIVSLVLFFLQSSAGKEIMSDFNSKESNDIPKDVTTAEISDSDTVEENETEPTDD